MSDTTEQPTLTDLRAEARELELEGYSKMNRDELEAALLVARDHREAALAAAAADAEAKAATAAAEDASGDDQAGDSGVEGLPPLAEVGRARYEDEMARAVILDDTTPEGS